MLQFSGEKESSTPTHNKTEPSGGDKASFRLGYHSPHIIKIKEINLCKIQIYAIQLSFLNFHFSYFQIIRQSNATGSC